MYNNTAIEAAASSTCVTLESVHKLSACKAFLKPSTCGYEATGFPAHKLDKGTLLRGDYTLLSTQFHHPSPARMHVMHGTFPASKLAETCKHTCKLPCMHTLPKRGLQKRNIDHGRSLPLCSSDVHGLPKTHESIRKGLGSIYSNGFRKRKRHIALNPYLEAFNKRVALVAIPHVHKDS